MASNKRIVKEVSDVLGIDFEPKRHDAFGVYRNYTLLIFDNNSDKKKKITASFCVRGNGGAADAAVFSAVIPKGVECYIDKDKFRIYLLFEIKGSLKKNIATITDTTEAVIDVFEKNGYVNCDQIGIPGPTDIYKVKGYYNFLNETTAKGVQESIMNDAEMDLLNKEHYFRGILGATLGACIGATVFLITAIVGMVYLYFLGGFAMGFLTVYFYRKFAGKFSLFSFCTCIVIPTVLAYLVFRLNAAFNIFFKMAGNLKVNMTFADCFINTRKIYDLAGAGNIYVQDFWRLIIIGILFALLPAYIAYKGQKDRFSMYKL